MRSGGNVAWANADCQSGFDFLDNLRFLLSLYLLPYLLWTLPVFFIVENPALQHRFRTRETPHLQAVEIVAQCLRQKQAEIQIFL